MAYSTRLATHPRNCARCWLLLFTPLASSLGPSWKVSWGSREFGKVASHKHRRPVITSSFFDSLLCIPESNELAGRTIGNACRGRTHPTEPWPTQFVKSIQLKSRSAVVEDSLWGEIQRQDTYWGLHHVFSTYGISFYNCNPFFKKFFFIEWSGINALLYYGPTLVRRMGLTNDVVSLIVSGGIGIVQLFAVLPAIVWIDKVGRRPLLRGV